MKEAWDIINDNKWTSETLISISLRVLHENDSAIEDTHDNTLSA